MTDVVIGAGEVGRAVAEVLGDDVLLRDVEGEVVLADVIHVAFPWSPAFEDAVTEYQGLYGPSLTVIHSTVPVGTSRRLGAVHSPVTGRHPDLAPSIRTFVKFFGGPDAEQAADLFRARSVTCETVRDQETTEAGKLLATLQYGWTIALEKEARQFALSVGADPDVAYRRFNEAYNAGYAALGEPYRLPILRHMPGPIGGHCVISNARLTPTRLARVLLELDEGWAA